jgi:stage V sporulation protein R
MRTMKFFLLTDKAKESEYRIDAIHDTAGYRKIRNALAQSYDVGASEPDIQVIDVDLLGDRKLILRHNVRNGVRLAEASRDQTLRHVRKLWGYEVRLEEG